MPELPEVQTTVNGLNEVLLGLSIRDVWTDYGGAFHSGKNHIKNREYFPAFKKEVIGKKFLKAERRGKNILIHLSGGKTILVHMKMTGHIMYGRYQMTDEKQDPWKPLDKGPLEDPYNKFIHLVFTLSDGKQLVLSDMRRFAKVSVADTAGLLEHSDLAHLGPEPLDPKFTLAIFRERLMKRPGWKIKQALLAQDLVAGIGNIYSDEILWHGGVHPLRLVKNIEPGEWKKMFVGMQETLKKGIDFGGDSDSDYRNIRGERGAFQKQHEAYRRTGKPCRKRGCGGTIARIRIAGRSAHFCPVHQK